MKMIILLVKALPVCAALSVSAFHLLRPGPAVPTAERMVPPPNSRNALSPTTEREWSALPADPHELGYRAICVRYWEYAGQLPFSHRPDVRFPHPWHLLPTPEPAGARILLRADQFDPDRVDGPTESRPNVPETGTFPRLTAARRDSVLEHLAASLRLPARTLGPDPPSYGIRVECNGPQAARLVPSGTGLSINSLRVIFLAPQWAIRVELLFTVSIIIYPHFLFLFLIYFFLVCGFC